MVDSQFGDYPGYICWLFNRTGFSICVCGVMFNIHAAMQ